MRSLTVTLIALALQLLCLLETLLVLCEPFFRNAVSLMLGGIVILPLEHSLGTSLTALLPPEWI